MRTFFRNLRRLAAEFGYAMCRMNEIQFSAPWSRQRSRCG